MHLSELDPYDNTVVSGLGMSYMRLGMRPHQAGMRLHEAGYKRALSHELDTKYHTIHTHYTQQLLLDGFLSFVT